MAKKEQKRVNLIEGDHSTELVSGKIPDIISKLQTLATKAPEEYRDQIYIELESFDYWGCPAISLDAYYYRDETDTEQEERLARERATQEQRDRHERAELERLKKKFEL